MDPLVAHIRSIHQETIDTKSFELETSPKLAYLPGQFLSVVIPDGTQAVTRQYSFSSHPALDPYPTITVKRIPNGSASRWFFDHAQVGDTLLTSGVSGRFTLPQQTNSLTHVVLLAAGSGITPVYSILKECLANHSHLRVTMIYSNHTEESTIFLNELREWKARFPTRLNLELLFSDAKDLRRARLGKYILEELLHVHQSDPKKTLAFICGPLSYRQMAIITLLNNGIPDEQIRREVFYSSVAGTRPEPPDRDAHLVNLTWGGDTHRFSVRYPQTILMGARAAGLDLPSSCEAGRCGTCTLTCSKGTVWMSRNEVLLDSEVERGRVLTCTGYPVGGDVWVQKD